jgi:hypothetical protein
MDCRLPVEAPQTTINETESRSLLTHVTYTRASVAPSSIGSAVCSLQQFLRQAGQRRPDGILEIADTHHTLIGHLAHRVCQTT